MKPPTTPPPKPPKPFDLKEFGRQLAEEAVKNLNRASTRHDLIPPSNPAPSPEPPTEVSAKKPFNLKEFGQQMAEAAVKKLNKLP